VNHRLKQYKHPLLLALVLLALNTTFFVTMIFYLADGPEMPGEIADVQAYLSSAIEKQKFKDIADKPLFAMNK
jgi:hypothetical protein